MWYPLIDLLEAGTVIAIDREGVGQGLMSQIDRGLAHGPQIVDVDIVNMVVIVVDLLVGAGLIPMIVRDQGALVVALGIVHCLTKVTDGDRVVVAQGIVIDGGIDLRHHVAIRKSTMTAGDDAVQLRKVPLSMIRAEEGDMGPHTASIVLHPCHQAGLQEHTPHVIRIGSMLHPFLVSMLSQTHPVPKSSPEAHSSRPLPHWFRLINSH